MPLSRRRGRLERLAFTFMGPPELGDLTAPPPEPRADTTRCSKCHDLYADHEVVRDPRLTYTRCPAR